MEDTLLDDNAAEYDVIEDEEDEEDETGAGELATGEAGGEFYNTGSSGESGTDSLTWVSWFCSLSGHEYFAEVQEEFIEDDFNLTGLNALVPFYKEALEMILDVEPEEESLKVPDISIIESSAELLYGLIHQRFILTRQGLHQMVDKYEQGHFGVCPRVYCQNAMVLPTGRSDLPGLDTVKLYCPNCFDIYIPPSSRYLSIDGAFFGTTFPHLLLQTYHELQPSLTILPSKKAASISGTGDSATGPPASSSASTTTTTTEGSSSAPSSTRPAASRIYHPRIYGFKVSERSKVGPRMQWLRRRPMDDAEFDRVDGYGRWTVPASKRTYPGAPEGSVTAREASSVSRSGSGLSMDSPSREGTRPPGVAAAAAAAAGGGHDDGYQEDDPDSVAVQRHSKAGRPGESDEGMTVDYTRADDPARSESERSKRDRMDD